MDFFNPSSFKEARVSMSTIRDWAGIVANSYLNSNVTPFDSIVKLAQDQELTPDNIKTLSGEVNKLIHQHKYASVENKYHAADFPMADAQKIINHLSIDTGSVKVAAITVEPKFTRPEFDFFKALGVEDKPLDKTASLKRELSQTMEDLSIAKKDAEGKEFLQKFAAQASERRFIKIAREMVLQNANSQSERLKHLGEMNHFFKCAKAEKIAKPLLAKVASSLTMEGYISKDNGDKAVDYFLDKIADEIAPQELISEHLPARVINGKHPLFIALKTYHHDNNFASAPLQQFKQKIDEKNTIISQRMRAL